MGDDGHIGGEVVEGEADVAICKKGMGPYTDGRGEPKVSHDADQTIDIEVIKEPLDIK